MSLLRYSAIRVGNWLRRCVLDASMMVADGCALIARKLMSVGGECSCRWLTHRE